jgi:hypothetical protein
MKDNLRPDYLDPFLNVARLICRGESPIWLAEHQFLRRIASLHNKWNHNDMSRGADSEMANAPRRSLWFGQVKPSGLVSRIVR